MLILRYVIYYMLYIPTIFFGHVTLGTLEVQRGPRAQEATTESEWSSQFEMVREA